MRLVCIWAGEEEKTIDEHNIRGKFRRAANKKTHDDKKSLEQTASETLFKQPTASNSFVINSEWTRPLIKLCTMINYGSNMMHVDQFRKMETYSPKSSPRGGRSPIVSRQDSSGTLKTTISLGKNPSIVHSGPFYLMKEPPGKHSITPLNPSPFNHTFECTTRHEK